MSNDELGYRVAALEQTVANLQQQLSLLLEDADDEQLVELTDELKDEINRRVAAANAQPGASIPWEQVKSEALARLEKK